MAAPDPLALLAHHAAVVPRMPWLFAHTPRGDHAWRWWSWSQVADRVARAASSLRAEIGEPAAARVGFRDRLDPDSLASRLAILAAGAIAVGAVDEGELPAVDLWLGPDPPSGCGLPVVALPEVRSRLDRWTPAELPVAPAPPGVASTPWTAVLAPRGAAASPKWHVWRFFTDRWRFRRRPLVVASALTTAAEQGSLLAAVLGCGAAWALEADPDSFVPAVLWARPTAVVAPATELGLLAIAFRRGAARRARRLRAVLVTDDGPPEIAEDEAWRELGVEVFRLHHQAGR